MNTNRILVVDDEEKIRTIIRKYAEFEGYQVTEAASGMEAVSLCRKQDFDMMIMDIMMPELDGFSAVREIRKRKDIPALMLSARGEEYDKIHGFEVGADDYVVKPFSPRELMMRVNVILQRNGKKDAGVRRVTFTHEGLVVDFTARTVQVDGETVELSPKTYDLLFYLVKNRGIALTREQLISNVWGYDFFGDDRTLDTHVKLLRSSLGKYRDLIVTLRGVGYRFEA
jgi:two-component system response regulator ResD